MILTKVLGLSTGVLAASLISFYGYHKVVITTAQQNIEALQETVEVKKLKIVAQSSSIKLHKDLSEKWNQSARIRSDKILDTYVNSIEEANQWLLNN